MKGHRARLEQAGKLAKDAARAQVETIEQMSIDEFISKMESGELLPEGRLQENQKTPWRRLAETTEGLQTLEKYKHQLTKLLRSEVVEDIDALVQEQTTAIDATLAKVDKASLPEELLQALKEHETFLTDEEAGTRAKAREQRALQQAAADVLGWDQPSPSELVTVAEMLRRPVTGTDPTKMRAKRWKVISEVRNVHGAERPPQYEGHIFDKVLVENQGALARSRTALHRINPDVIVGMERGGAFLTEALVEKDAALAAKVRKMRDYKAPEGSKGKYDGPKMQAEFQKLIDAGAKQIVVYDAYMGGRTARALVDQVFKPLAPRNPGVTFQLYWLRETFGLRGAEVVGEENLAGSLHPDSPHAKAILPSLVENVTLVLGDDMDVVMSPNGMEPLRIFNSSGEITEMLTPKPGQTTRQVLIELLNRPPSSAKPPVSEDIPVLPAPPRTSRKKN